MNPSESPPELLQERAGAEAAERFDPDRLHVYLWRWADQGATLYGALLALLTLACAALPVVQVPVSVHAEGHLRAGAATLSVMAPENGWVRWVRPGEPASVTAGDTLLLLGRPELEARTATLRSRERRLEAETSDLRALLTATRVGGEAPFLPSLRYGAEWDRLHVESRRLQEALAVARREERSVAALARQGLLPAAEAESARSRVRELEREVEIFRSRRESHWRQELARTLHEAEVLRLETARLEQQRSQLAVLSPATGELEYVQPYSAGSFVAAGTPIASVIPSSDLVAELLVDPGDLLWLAPGSAARLQLRSGSYGPWKSIRGRVYEVAPPTTRVGERAASWVRVRLEPADEAGAQDHLRLRRGLDVSARLPVGRRSLLSLLRGGIRSPRGAAPPGNVPDEPAG